MKSVSIIQLSLDILPHYELQQGNHYLSYKEKMSPIFQKFK